LSRRSAISVALIALATGTIALVLGRFTAFWASGLGVSAVAALRGVAHVIEAAALLYGVAFSVGAIRYVLICRRRPDRGEPTPGDGPRPRLAILYLCCGDLEPEALESLTRLQYSGPVLHLLHDDSTDPDRQREVDRAVKSVKNRLGVEWRVMRRASKGGGKSAVTNHVLEQTADEHDLLLLADNDSYAHDPVLFEKAVPVFADDSVSIVQFRNRAEHRPDEGPFTRLLGGAIDMFDAFMTGMYRGLWQPFVGHNAVLRTRDLVKAGGFTPGVFADDIDLTVRMNRHGKRVVYRRDIEMSECHPPNYRSFCTRSQKWSTGCAQVLRLHGLRVLLDKRLTLQQKLGFFLFCGFYLTQAAILAYVAIVLLILPVAWGESWEAAGWALVVGTFFPITIFFPVLAYLRTEGRHLPFWPTLGVCAATYGSTDWWTLRGLLGGFGAREMPWVPTNNVANTSRQACDWTHFCCGVAALAVPWTFQPELLLFPITWLFAAKLIFVPVVASYYREPRPTDARAPLGRPASLSSSLAPLVALGAVVAFLGLIGVARAHGQTTGGDGLGHAQVSRVGIDGSSILIEGEPIIIKGIHYAPWLPGTGPGKGFEHPGEEVLRRDLDMIRRTGANTILVYDPAPDLVGFAAEYGLNVICTFHIEWWQLPAGQLDEVEQRITRRVDELRDHDAIIAWMLGNEVHGWVIDEMGPVGVREALGELREAIRQIDSTRPVCHGNFALHRTLGIDSEMDIVAYNIYPFYPTEVIAQGYEQFIASEILPLTKGRALLITEFGLNTLEATEERQAQVLRDCWEDLLDAGCQGGIVFEFADEWWKNYDNPVQPPDWWRREQAPDDHLTHDRDPEEYYGIVTSKRIPKSAYNAVSEMFGGTKAQFEPVPTPALDRRRLIERSAWLAGGGAITALIGLSVLLWWRAWRPDHADPNAAGSESS